MKGALDIAVNDGLVFDGTGSPPQIASVAIKDGRVEQIRPAPFTPDEAQQLVDARGKWVTPGFIDVHTHYDAELEAAPALGESLRHGVTTVMIGSCSLGTVLSSPEDIADMFTRVEAVPREFVLPLFEKKKDWNTPSEYRAHLDELALGPNVAAFLGHSDLRCAHMGLTRSVTRGLKPNGTERQRMRASVTDALDSGFLGLSCNTNRWDKLGGTRHRSLPLPSTYAKWGEILELAHLVRHRGRVLQAIPNISAKYDAALFALLSAPWRGTPLKTSLVSMVDVRSNRHVYKALGGLALLVNRTTGANFRVQSLPMPFKMFVDGLDAPVFEEFDAGTAALHIENMAERRELLNDANYRDWFRKQWTSFWAPKVFHRDFGQTEIVSCPDSAVLGRSFVDIAKEKGTDAITAFLDLAAEHGDELRWLTTIGNDRPDHLRAIMEHPAAQVGFADSGAHLRNLAFYNFPLFLLRMSLQAQQQGIAFLPPEQAVRRLTSEIADWYGIDAGHIHAGARADLAVVNPDALDQRLDDMVEAPMPSFGGLSRVVRRNDDAIPAVIVNGRLAVERGQPLAVVGREQGFGRFLPAR